MSDGFDPTTAPPPAASAPAAPAAPAATPTPAPAAAAPASPYAAPQAPATGAAPHVEPSWLKGRLDETRNSALRQAAEAFERREAQYREQVQQYQRQLQALVGVNPPANPEIDQVRQQFAQVYPGLSKMEQYADRLEQLFAQSQELQSQNSHYWQSYGRSTMNRLFEKAEESIGAPLSEAGKRQLHSAFTGYVSSTPELIQRYTQDPSLVDEFWDGFNTNFVTPARRAPLANAEMRTAQPLPSNQPGGMPQTTPAPRAENMDQRAAQAWAAYQHASRNNLG